MSEKETIGWGTEFHLGNGASPNVLVELEKVFELTPPEETADDIEVTHFKSPQRRREFIRGLIDSGEFEVQMNYIAGSPTDELCRDAFNAGDTRPFKTVIPDETGQPGWEIAGFVYVKSYARAIPLDDKLTATLTCKVTGAVAEAAPAGGGA
jgi:predicted secreted protein